jgi:hypothetical protein
MGPAGFGVIGGVGTGAAATDEARMRIEVAAKRRDRRGRAEIMKATPA